MTYVARLLVVLLSMSILGNLLEIFDGSADWMDGVFMAVQLFLLGGWLVRGEAVWGDEKP